MENNDNLRRIKLFMNYDSKKTLKENEKKIGKILLEYKKGTENLGNWCAKTNYNLGASGFDYVLKSGSCFKPKSDAGPDAWAYSSNDPFESDDPLVFQCNRKNPISSVPSSYLWEPEGYGDFFEKGLSWTGRKLYYNNQLEAELKAHFCTAAKPKATVPATKLCDVYKARAANPVQPNAGDIQKFLKELGSNINVDFAFGPGTATAVGTYLYGGDKGINTVQSLHAKLVETGKLPQGDVPGFGPKMAQAVADLLNAAIKANTNCTQAAA
jgi:hypothetical protein